MALSPFEECWWAISHSAAYPKQMCGWWERPPALLTEASESSCVQAGTLHVKYKKKIKISGNVGPVMLSVIYGNAACIHLSYAIKSTH